VLEKDLLHKENEALRAENVKLEQQNKYRKPGVHRLPSNYYEDEEEG
jgi:cell division protein FtsB